MINKKHLIKLIIFFLALDIVVGLIMFLTKPEIKFSEYLIFSGISIVGFIFFFSILLILYSLEFNFAFSWNVIAQLIGTFICLIVCIIKLNEGTIYLIGFVIVIPLFTNAVIWEYFPNFYLQKAD